METKLEQLNSQLAEAIAKLDAVTSKMSVEMQAIRAKYDADIETLTEHKNSLSAAVKSENAVIRNNKINQDWEEAQAKNEITAFYLAAMFRKLSPDNFIMPAFSKKPELKNGIVIWLADTSEDYRKQYKLYLAFKGTGLVGTSYRENSKHAADGTTPFSFIGQFDELLMAKKTSENYPEGWSVNATFTEWSKKLGELKEGVIPVMVMTEETLTELKDGINNYWSEYGWEYYKPKK